MTASRLREKYTYNPDSGLFIRNERMNNRKKGTVGGSKNGAGYISIKIDGKVYQAHRLAWLYMTGEFPESDIDHINHVRDDNRWENLREITRQGNTQNASLSKNNTSGCTGVVWHKLVNKWEAKITVDYKTINLGYHTEYSDAVNARKNAEVLYGFHENHGTERVSNG